MFTHLLHININDKIFVKGFKKYINITFLTHKVNIELFVKIIFFKKKLGVRKITDFYFTLW